MNRERLEAVISLVEFSAPLASLAETIHGVEWEYDSVPFLISSMHVISILRRYLAGIRATGRTRQICWKAGPRLKMESARSASLMSKAVFVENILR